MQTTSLLQTRRRKSARAIPVEPPSLAAPPQPPARSLCCSSMPMTTNDNHTHHQHSSRSTHPLAHSTPQRWRQWGGSCHKTPCLHTTLPCHLHDAFIKAPWGAPPWGARLGCNWQGSHACITLCKTTPGSKTRPLSASVLCLRLQLHRCCAPLTGQNENMAAFTKTTQGTPTIS